MKSLRHWIVPMAVVAGLWGCSGQDSGQPPVNSIKVGPKSDKPLTQAPKGAAPASPAKKP